MIESYQIEDLGKSLGYIQKQLEELTGAVDDFAILYGFVHGYEMDNNGKWVKKEGGA